MRRVDAEEQAHHRRQRYAHHNRGHRRRHGHGREGPHQHSHHPRNDHTDHATARRQHRRFHQELIQDVALAGADGLADADFVGPVRDYGQHYFHYPPPAPPQGFRDHSHGRGRDG